MFPMQRTPSKDTPSNCGEKGKRKAQYCDIDRVTVPESSKYFNLALVGKALCRKHYNQLIVNAKKSKKTNVCSHPKHETYCILLQHEREWVETHSRKFWNG